MELSTNQRPLDGCLFESSPAPSAVASAAADAELPKLVDLRQHCSPVEDQRLTNSCTANAIVGALEYHQIRRGESVTDLSRMFVYYNARQLANAESKDVGSMIHHVMAAVLAHGACEERLWPFQEAMCTVRPTDACYRDAERFQAVQYARTPLGAPAMAAVAAGLPVVFGTYIPKSFYDEAGATKKMPAPGERIERPGSGHAMLLVGYDQDAQEWIVRNSWGPTWADGGYMRVPFATLAAYSDPTHYWTIGAIDRATTLRMQAPASTELGARSSGLDVGGALDRARAAREEISRSVEEKRRGFRDRLRGN